MREPRGQVEWWVAQPCQLAAENENLTVARYDLIGWFFSDTPRIGTPELSGKHAGEGMETLKILNF